MVRQDTNFVETRRALGAGAVVYAFMTTTPFCTAMSVPNSTASSVRLGLILALGNEQSSFFKMEGSMTTVRKFLVGPLVILMAASSSAFAGQRHVIDPGQLAATVAEHAARQDANRAAVNDAIARPEVRDLASKMGIDVARAAASAATLSGADLERAAATARQVNQQLVGGASTVVISTTTIIIVLLLVLLIVVAVD